MSRNLFISGSKYPAKGPDDKYIIKYSNTGAVDWFKSATTTTSSGTLQGLGVVAEDRLYIYIYGWVFW